MGLNRREHIRKTNVLRRNFPWGFTFAKRENFEGGYFIKESQLVEKFLTKPSDVLVIGSGNGREARPICQNGHKIVCIDVVEAYLKSGRELFSSIGVNSVQFIKADMADLPFKDKSFDFIFFTLYSFAGADRFKVLGGINRVLKPERNLLLVSVTHRYRKIANWVYIDSASQLRKEVSQCGFNLIESGVDPKRQEYRFSMLRKIKGSISMIENFKTSGVDLLSLAVKQNGRALSNFRGNSMRPTLTEGMQILVEKIESKDVKLADIILYRRGNSMVVHRVIRILQKDSRRVFITKADAHSYHVDPVPIPQDDLIGRVQSAFHKEGPQKNVLVKNRLIGKLYVIIGNLVLFFKKNGKFIPRFIRITFRYFVRGFFFVFTRLIHFAYLRMQKERYE